MARKMSGKNGVPKPIEMKEYLQSFRILTDEEIDFVLSAGHHKKIKKDDYFIREGQICKEVMYIKSGFFFRSFYTNEKGHEITYCFTFEKSFTTAYSSFITQQQTLENIYAMADAEIFVLPREKIISLEKESVNWLRFSKMLAEQEYINMEQRIFLLLRQKAETKYKELLSKHPEYVQNIPLHHLASYLGITQRHLSRIRGFYN